MQRTFLARLFAFAASPMFIAGMAFPLSAGAAIGTIVFTSGNVAIRSPSGTQRPAIIGAPLEVGDSVLTNDGRAQVRFTDEGFISLQPATEFRVENYSYANRTDGTEKAIFNLVKGGLRAVTGLIGKVNKSAYQVNTIVATIGIRGTTYQALLCAGGCTVPDGLYVKGGEGTVIVRNAFGSIDLSRGETAYVPNAKQPPQPTTTVPRVGTAPSATPASYTNTIHSEFPAGDLAKKASGFDFTGPLHTVNVTGGGAAGATTGGSVSFTGSLNGSSLPFTTTAQGSIGAIAGIINPADVSLTTLIFSGTSVIGVSATSPLGSVFVITSNVENPGTDGNLFWGRWANGNILAKATFNGQTAQVAGSLSGATSLAYIFGTQAATMPVIGSATYGFNGGPPSTSDGGSIGNGVTGGTLNVNFAGAGSVSVNMTVNHNGIYNLASGPITLNASNRAVFANAIPFMSSGAGAYPSMVNGFFSGSNSVPQSAGLAYQIQKPADFINGVAGFGCRVGC